MEPEARFILPPKASFFLFGPRGTGKTTWLHRVFPDALFVNLLEPETARELSARPERLRELILGNPERTDVVVDEVQRIPELLQVVHDVIESPRAPRFILTGSSARKLRKEGVNLLGGRAVVRTLHPFMAAEWPAFDLDRALITGLVPLVVSAPDPRDSLSAYTGLYVEQEVKSEGLVRQMGSFSRFLEAVSFSHGSVLTVTDVARDAAVGRKTVEGFIEVLEDLLIAFRVPVFTKWAKRATIMHQKFYYFDAGVFRSLRPSGPLDRPSEIEGAALEGLVAQHLRAWIAYTNADHELSYWRTRAGAEVDFIVYGSTDFTAIEVTSSDRIRPADLRALQSFRDDYPECQPLLLYRGTNKLVMNGIPCWPVDEFLRRLRPRQPIAPIVQMPPG